MQQTFEISISLIYACIALIIALAFAFVVFIFKARRNKKEMINELEKRTASFLEQVEIAKEAVKVKSDFLSHMSHEIRTPLNAIYGMVQIIRNMTDLYRINECINKAEQSLKHLLGIVNDILDLSKMESGALVLEENLFSLSHEISFIESMFKVNAAEKNLSLIIKMENIQNDGIITDSLRLNQVLINFMSNAVKFTEPNGTIELTVEELFHLEGQSAYRFSVRDNGPGIKPEQAKKLFTPFTQANSDVSRLYGGTGLGLTISQSIVQMMGGDIELETEYGFGSMFTFTIRVPAIKSVDESSKSEDTPKSPNKLHGKRFLVVDDIDINREIIEALLEGSGAIIEVASNGKEALDAFVNSEPHWYDLILMDMQMPIMDGYAATEEIRLSGKEDAEKVIIFAMTANVMREDVTRAYQCGMNSYLAKPIEYDVLYAEMEEWL